MSHILSGKLLAGSAAVLLSIPMIIAPSVKADSVNYGMQIIPRCSDASTNLTYWEVISDSPDYVKVDWLNRDVNKAGSVLVNNTTKYIATYFDGSVSNNTTKFNWGNGSEGQTNAQKDSCATIPVVTPTDCLPTHLSDGYLQDHINVTYLNDNTVQVDYDALECSVDVNFSSYIMLNYDPTQGDFFNNPTAHDQIIFDNNGLSIAAGQAGSMTLTVGLPDSCNYIQLDAYFGNVLVNVGAEGHGTRNLGSQVLNPDESCFETETPDQGDGGTTPTTPVDNTGGQGSGTETETVVETTTEVVTPVQAGKGAGTTGATSATLEDTGVSSLAASLMALGLIGVTAVVTRLTRKNS